MRILVTGCNGFVGHNLVHLLEKNQIEVVGLDRVRTPRSPENFIPLNLGEPHPNEEYAYRLRKEFSEIVEKVDSIVHLASDRGGSYVVENNPSSLMALLKAAQKAKTKQIVLLSTAEVGMSDEGSLTEKNTPLACASSYAASKACEEFIAQHFVNAFDLPIVTIRSVNIFGDGQSDGPIPILSKMILDGRNIKVPATEMKEWVHVSHVCDVLNEVAVSTMIPPGTVLHVTGTKEIYTSTLAYSIMGILGKQVQLHLTKDQVTRHSLKRTEETDRFLLDNRYDESLFSIHLRQTVLFFEKENLKQ